MIPPENLTRLTPLTPASARTTVEISSDEHGDNCCLRFLLRKYLGMPSADGSVKRRDLRKAMAKIIEPRKEFVGP